jgi:uncharacterized GH25 family protein
VTVDLLEEAASKGSANAVTDAEGKFNFTVADVENKKNYTAAVKITKENFDSASFNSNFSLENNYTNQSINVLLQQEKAHVTIRGRVIFEDGSPADGVTVKGNLTRSENATEPDVQQDVKTETNGSFVWYHRDNKGPNYYVNLSFEKPLHSGSNESVIASIDNEYLQDLGIIKITRVPTNGSLLGRLVDSQGNPIANSTIGILINGREVTTTTDSNGNINYTDTNIFRGTDYNVTWSYAGNENFAPTNGTVQWNEGNQFTQNTGQILLPRNSITGVIQGVALDENGKPISDATIRVTIPGTDITQEVRSDSEGRYNVSLPGLETGRNYTVNTEITATDKDPINLQSNISSESNYSSSENVTVPFIPLNGSVSGQVFDENGNPFEGVNVSVIANDVVLGSALAGKDGQVRVIPNVLSGFRYNVSVIINDTFYEVKNITTQLTPDNKYEFFFQSVALIRSHSNIKCMGRIQHNGQPVANLTVSIDLIKENRTVSAVTDETGQFSINEKAKHLPLIPGLLVLSDPERDAYKNRSLEIGFYEGNDYTVNVNVLTVDLKYSPLVFDGIVRSSANGNPIANATITLIFGENLKNWTNSTTTNENGSFSFDGQKFERGLTYRAKLNVSHPDHKNETFDLSFDPNNQYRINGKDIQLGNLRGEATISGQILDADGKPFSNGTVTITINETGQTVTVPLDENGRYNATLDDVVLGPNYTATVNVTAPGYRPSNFTLNLTSENNYTTTPLEQVSMIPSVGFYEVICRGQLLGNGGLPLRSVPVLLVLPSESEKEFWAMTDTNGYVEFKDKIQGLPQLPCSLSITDPNGVYLPNNQTKMHVNAEGWIHDYRYINVDKADVAIKGVVKDTHTGKPISGANVTLTFDKNLKGAVRNIVTSDDGSFSVFEPGYPRSVNYSVEVQVNKSQYNNFSQTLQLTSANNFQNKSLEVSLKPRQITVLLEGRVVDEDGKPIEGALVEAIYGDIVVNTTLSGPSGNYSVIVRDAVIGDGQPGVVRVTPPKARKVVVTNNFKRYHERVVYKVDDVTFSNDHSVAASGTLVYPIPSGQSVVNVDSTKQMTPEGRKWVDQVTKISEPSTGNKQISPPAEAFVDSYTKINNKQISPEGEVFIDQVRRINNVPNTKQISPEGKVFVDKVTRISNAPNTKQISPPAQAFVDSYTKVNKVTTSMEDKNTQPAAKHTQTTGIKNAITRRVRSGQ